MQAFFNDELVKLEAIHLRRGSLYFAFFINKVVCNRLFKCAYEVKLLLISTFDYTITHNFMENT